MKFNKMKLAALAMSALMAASTVSPAVYAADLFSDGTAPAEEVFISEEPEVVAEDAPLIQDSQDSQKSVAGAKELLPETVKWPESEDDLTVSFEYTQDGEKFSDKVTATIESRREKPTCTQGSGFTVKAVILGKEYFHDVDQISKLGHKWEKTGFYRYKDEPATHDADGWAYEEEKCTVCGEYRPYENQELVPMKKAHTYSVVNYYYVTDTYKADVELTGKVLEGDSYTSDRVFGDTISGDLYEVQVDANNRPIVKTASLTKNIYYYVVNFCTQYDGKNDKGIKAIQRICGASQSSYWVVDDISSSIAMDSDEIKAVVEKGYTYKDIKLVKCYEGGEFTIYYYRDANAAAADIAGGSKRDDYIAKLPVTIPAHHDEKVYIQFKSKDVFKQCTVDSAKGTVKNNFCQEVTYTVVTYCANDHRDVNNKVYCDLPVSDVKNVVDENNTGLTDVSGVRVVGTYEQKLDPTDNHAINNYAKNEIDKVGNNYDKIVDIAKKYADVAVSTDATCTTAGTVTVDYSCNYCKKITYSQKISVPALGHKMVYKVVENKVDATCAKAGSFDRVDKCTREGCTYELNREHFTEKQLPHANEGYTNSIVFNKDVEWKIKLKGDVVVQGSKGEIEKKENWSDWDVNPDDKRVGKEKDLAVTPVIYSVCKKCGANEVELSKEAMKNNIGYVTVEITKLEKQKYKCLPGVISITATYNNGLTNANKINVSVSKDAEYYSSIEDYRARTNHSLAVRKENEVAATDKAAGSYDEVTYCTVCGTVTGTEKVTVPALGAKFDFTVAEKVVYTGSELKPEVTVKDGDTTLVAGTDYEVAYSNNVNPGKEAVVTVTGKGIYAGTVTKNFEIDPAEPVVTSAKSTGYNSVKVTWDAAAGAKSYRLYYRGGDATKWTLVRNGIKGTELSYASSDLVSGVTYRYTVVAVNGSVKSTFSAKGKCAAIKPAAPAASVTFSGKKAVLTWKKVAGASGYIIQSKAPDGKWTRVGTVKSGTKVTWTDKSAVSGTSYRVRAYRTVENVNVYGPFSAAAN